MDFEHWFLRYGEGAQYAAYFGMLLVMGLSEVWGRAPTRSQRWPRWGTNFALTAVNIVTLGALPLSFIAAAGFTSARELGLMNQVPLPTLAVVLLGFLGRGFISWLTHLLMHKVPLFWRVHRVHHTDTELDISTTVRFHPLEFPIGLLIGLPFIVALGIPPWVLLAYELLDVVVTVFSHANVALPRRVERWLRYIVVTPSLHRVHHSVVPRETDSNFSAVFPVWDWVFGTLRVRTEEPLDTLSLGLNEVRDERSTSFRWLLALPFRNELASTFSRR